MRAGDVNKCFDANGENGCQPYRVGCHNWLIHLGHNTGTLDCYTFGGQSGSPVWLYDTINRSRVIRGVLVAETGNIGRFTFITGRVFTWLQTYVRHSRV